MNTVSKLCLALVLVVLGVTVSSTITPNTYSVCTKDILLVGDKNPASEPGGL